MKIMFLTLFLCVACVNAYGWTLIGSGIQGWPTYQLVFYVNPDGCLISEAELMDYVDRAISVWNGIPSSSLSLSRATDNSTLTPAEFQAGATRDMPIVFCDPSFATSIGDENVVPAAAILSSSATVLSRAAIYLNAQTGAGAELSRLDSGQVRITLAHEMGHVLGLGHTSKQESLMYYRISGKDEPRLSEDDIQGLSFIYPRSEFGRGTFGCASSHGRGGQSPWNTLISFFCVSFVWFLGRKVAFPKKSYQT